MRPISRPSWWQMSLRVVLTFETRWSVSRHRTLRCETCRCGLAHTRTTVGSGSRQSVRANKPKALSAPLTAELGTKARSRSRAVLLADKTPPCPNKSGPFLAHDEQLWSLLHKSEAKRLVLPRNDAICIRVSQTELLLRKRMQSYSEKSRTSQIRPRVGVRLKRSLDGYAHWA